MIRGSAANQGGGANRRSAATRDGDEQDALWALIRAIGARDEPGAIALLQASPSLAHEAVSAGGTRSNAADFYLEPISHYVYARDTALHIAAAAYATATVRLLLAGGANVHARNRRGAQPLHYAADGAPDGVHWNPESQHDVVACLIQAGADPNAIDDSGVAALHRAVRTRCASAVKALLDHGADPKLQNRNGSTAYDLAQRTTGRGGSGSAAAREQQRQIVALLAR